MKTFIQFIKNIYISLFPEQHKKKSFSNINSLTWGNIHQQNFENELLLLKYLVDKDSVFIDVGSNIGQYIFMAEKVLNPENIYAFEPNPILFKRLKKIFSNVNIFDIAFSDTNSSASFKIP
ncbi:MAG: FkbM family methyltransferase, partial [Bacteroidota bacterium]|nr:FkbM family methyltransferase [Bacteroidota bacterium]